MGTSISRTTNIIVNLFLIVLVLLCLLPIVLVLSVSFTDETSLLNQGYNFIPGKFSIEPYRFLMDTNLSGILNAYKITIFNTVVGTMLTLLMVALYAYPLSRKDLKYNNFFTFFLYFTMLFGGGMVPWYLVCTQVLGLKDSIWAMILPSIFNGFFVFVMRTFYKSTIPVEVLESAKIDGAGEYRIFFQIVLPLSLPAIATVAIFTAVGFWNDYWLPLMLINDPKLSNLQYMIYRIMTNIQAIREYSQDASGIATSLANAPSEGIRMAMAMITMGPIVLIYPFLQKYFVKGLTIGAIKG
ncbi:carbohydrate ABC transporter permease [Paenibacillus sp. JDR-2]|uniref:carbohydrate ABC transporter permease n=1 Tax=Paenibacillus sp. (strain JDR-2) TaxID=324057 RepID=UPI0001666CE8|nr:carbohydrate ABC transporter permease [Paenibacillus sp. JDR-2]ACT01215.1 binding-protein-dependent transport systems inner membrane component [Paenibacillus sp. JDR-2]